MVAVQQRMTCRDRIVATARCMFSKYGFHKTAMADLAANSEVSVGQIYRLFKSKNDIVITIVNEDAEQRFGKMASLSDRVKRGELDIKVALTELATLSLLEGKEALSFEIMAEAHRNVVVADCIAKLCERYRAIFRDIACVANPKLSDIHLDGAEELLLACMFGLGHRSLSRPSLSVQETANETARMILKALRMKDRPESNNYCLADGAPAEAGTRFPTNQQDSQQAA